MVKVEAKQRAGICCRRLQTGHRQFSINPGGLLRCKETDLRRQGAPGIQSTRTREVAEDDATSPNKEMSVREPAEQPKKPFRGRNHRR